MAGWTNEQTRALLRLRDAADVQAQLNVVSVAIVHHTCRHALRGPLRNPGEATKRDVRLQLLFLMHSRIRKHLQPIASFTIVSVHIIFNAL